MAQGAARHEQIQPHRQRSIAQHRRRSGHAAALCAAGRPRPQQSSFRLRVGAMRRLHRASRRPADPFLRDAAFGRWQWQDHHIGWPRHAREATPVADRLCRRAGAAMRLLHQWLADDRRRLPARQEKTERGRDQGRALRLEVPLRHAHQHSQGGQACRRDDGLREGAMTKFEKTSSFTRRSVLLGSGALVVSIGAAVSLETVLSIGKAYAQGAKPPLTPDQLSSYIAVNADGSVSAFYGKMDMGQGLFVAIGQMVADELDVSFKSVKVIMGDTATSVNQGGASGSTGVQMGGKQMRVAAAEARRVLVEMAAGLLSVPAEKLVVNDGVVSASDDKSKKISYAQMIGGKYFNVQLDLHK